MQQTVKQREGRRQRLTDVQRWILDTLNTNGAYKTTDLGVELSNSHLGYYPGTRRRRWESPSECAQTHVAALVRKGYVERYARGCVAITPEGTERITRP